MKMNFQISRAGRPLSENRIRDKNGKSRGETVESIIATALAGRLKQGVPLETAIVRDERTGEAVAVNADTGHLLGQLKMLGRQDGLSENQFLTGMRFAQLVCQYAGINGVTLNIRAFDYGGVKGSSLSAPPDEKRILDIRGRYNDCCNLMADADRRQGTSNRIQKIVRLVCLEQITLREFNFDEGNLGNLRMGLNALVPMFKKAV